MGLIIFIGGILMGIAICTKNTEKAVEKEMWRICEDCKYKHIHEVEDKNNIIIEKEVITNGEVIQKVFSKDKFQIIPGLNYIEQWHNDDHVQNYLYDWWISKYEGDK